MARRNKKGEMGDVSSIVALIAGVGVAVLVLIFVSSLSGNVYNLVEPDIEEIGETRVTGLSITPLVNSSVASGYRDIFNVRLYNLTSLADIGTGNFTIDAEQGYLTLTQKSWNNSAIGANFSAGKIEIQNSIKNSVLSSFGAMETTSNYLPIVVLAVVIMFVLGMVMTFGGMTGGRGGGSAL
jgi:hypothetical protein